MPSFLLAYHGGGMAPTEEEQARAMAAWGQWFQELGSAVADAGAAVGQARTVDAAGDVSEGGGANPVTGYSVIHADDIDAAIRIAGRCPILKAGGSIEVCEAVPMS